MEYKPIWKIGSIAIVFVMVVNGIAVSAGPVNNASNHSYPAIKLVAAKKY